MFKKVTKERYADILKHLRQDISNCVYIYINLLNADRENADIEVWVQESGDKFEAVLMRYYESFRIYCKGTETDFDEAVSIMKAYEPKMIAGQEDVIEKLEQVMGGRYKAEYGGIYEIDSRKRLRNRFEVELASENDAVDIADLIAADEGLGGHYSLENLEKQIRSRIEAGTGRSYIIRENGRVAAHTATYAEADRCAVVSGTIIHPDFRDRGYYPVISSYMAAKLNEENKTAYTFAVEPRMIEYHDRMDIRCGSYGRLIQK